ncbi:S8 family serine peptidase [Alkalihalophilus lindianensis]|uniref:S8 family serine peptidase n=1 Tax=Alkalihalophilus lindianensis TaxID=1630542 RepID=A0ABU3XAK0_9BACI|nr:S8 family serine peptidase [Alkalihalophilus lindianensis]MDV2684333.1 S8 family serine peptidase [Alkalihalophilus lindianensis]
MNSTLKHTIILFLFSFFFFPSIGLAETEPYIVTFEEEADIETLREYDLTILEEFSLFPGAVIEADSEEYSIIKDLPIIHEIEKDQTFKVEAMSTVNWGIDHLFIPTAWASGYTGKDVKVAVIDSGISPHPALKVVKGKSMVDYTTSYSDDNGHGTHSAGIISARTNNQTVGVAHGVQLYAVKALDQEGNGRLIDTIRGIEWAVDEGVELINLSLGTLQPSTALKTAVDSAYENGVLIVAAAGNKKQNFSEPKPVEFPARYGSVIAVSAIDSRNRLANFSATGPEIEFTAPGVSIYSTHLNNSYRHMNGTSMATPFVTGILALYKEAYPDKKASEIRSLAQQSAKSLSGSSRSEQFGYGLIQPPTLIAPEGLNSTVTKRHDNSSASVSLSWTYPEKDRIKSYRIYRDAKLIATVPTLNFEEQLEAGTYEYSVAAIDSNGIESPKSSISTLKIERLASEQTFYDVKKDFWAYPNITFLSSKNIITGYRDGSFDPNASVRRGQAVTMIARALEWEFESIDTSFKDVKSDYFASGAIQEAVDKGIINGFSDGTFRPNAPISRAQMAAIVGKAFMIEGSSIAAYQDISENTTGYRQINRLTEMKIIKGYEGGLYKPNQPLTRAQFSVILSRILDEEFRLP